MSQRVLSVSDVEVGQELPPRTVHISRASLVQYAGASLDRNPIHWDERFARSVGLPDVIAQGMFTMGSAINVVSDWVGDAVSTGLVRDDHGLGEAGAVLH